MPSVNLGKVSGILLIVIFGAAIMATVAFAALVLV
jgi:hypothetical protein